MIDIVGHLGYAILIAGTLMIGRNMTSGWLVRTIGEVLWVVLGLLMGMTSIWVWGLVFSAIDFYNWRKWNANPPETKN